jgi:hypothetical protein
VTIVHGMGTDRPEWRSFLSQKHQGKRLGSVAAFRSRLLQLLLLLTHRYHPTQTWTNGDSLQKLRQQNMGRTTVWTDSHGLEKNFQTANRILDDSAITSARQHRASELALPPTFPLDQFSDPDRPALDQLLPLFIELTTARTLLGDGWEPTSDWFELAGQFMLQAVIDQYITNGHCSIERFTAIFAVGNPGAKHSSEGTDVTAMRSLFCTGDTSGTELPEWQRIRSSNIEAVSPQTKSSGDIRLTCSGERRLQHASERRRRVPVRQVREQPSLVSAAPARKRSQA